MLRFTRNQLTVTNCVAHLYVCSSTQILPPEDDLLLLKVPPIFFVD